MLAAERVALAATSPVALLEQDVEAIREAIGQPDEFRFGIVAGDGRIIGSINLTNVVRGAFRSANLGYWVAAAEQRRGHATTAVAETCAFAFGEAGLHRLEAGTLLENLASQRVLDRNGFTRIGVSPRHLEIAGAWRDHVLFARTADD